MPTTGAILAIVLAFLLLFVSGFASGSEIAFFSLSPNDLNELDEEKNTVDAKKENRQIYNLQGQKLDKMKPGLNIVNGKKYFVK